MKRSRIWMLSLAACGGMLVALTPAQPGQDKVGVDPKDIRPVLDKAVGFLKTTQGKDGSFSPKLAGPGITAVVVAGLLRGGIGADEPVVARGFKYLETQRKDDGGIYSKGLANYTTSIAVMAFHEANKGGKYDAIIKDASAFLKGIQKENDPKNPAFGGFGYDGKKRPRRIQHPTSPSKRCSPPACPRTTQPSRTPSSSSAAARTCPANSTTSRSPKKPARTTRAASPIIPSTSTTTRTRRPMAASARWAA